MPGAGLSRRPSERPRLESQPSSRTGETRRTFFHIDALSSAVGLKIDFDMALLVLASALYRLMARRMRGYHDAQARQIFRDLIDMPADVVITESEIRDPKLFSTMITDGFDLLTYRKGRCRRINERRFIRRRAELDGRWVHYLLHDQPVRFLKGKLRLRQVTRLCDGGHQTQVITSRRDLRVPRPISSTTACERFHKTVDWRRCVRTNGPRPTRPNSETG